MRDAPPSWSWSRSFDVALDSSEDADWSPYTHEDFKILQLNLYPARLQQKLDSLYFLHVCEDLDADSVKKPKMMGKNKKPKQTFQKLSEQEKKRSRIKRLP